MCGVFGIVSNNNVILKIAHGLYDLQHRGEQGMGVVIYDGKEFQIYKTEGLVAEAFREDNEGIIFEKLSGKAGIGHTLYSTIGKGGEKKQPKTIQPLVGSFHGEPFAVAHNGNLIDLEPLRRECKDNGYGFASEVSDTEVIVGLLATCVQTDFLDALQNVLLRLKGAFGLVILFRDKVIGVRDQLGIRPLCFGRDESSFILASESCAFYTLDASFIRDVSPGEIIILGKNGIEKSFIWAKNPCLRICIFEYVYFARPDSKIDGRSVYSYRFAAGQILAKECPVVVDVVLPVPESGRIYDRSYGQALDIPSADAMFRNRYFAYRTFLAARQTNRRSLQRIKMHPLREVVHGKRVCVIEDSVVRCNAASEVAAMLREAGATEVHFRVFSSPLRWPCFLGIDMATRAELVAAGLSIDEIGRRIIHADSLGYLSMEGMVRAVRLPKENLCLGCFDGEYPVEPPEDCNFKPPS